MICQSNKNICYFINENKTTKYVALNACFRNYILFRESESLFTILKRILRILTPFPQHNNKQNNPTVLFMMKVTWSQPRMFASPLIFTKLHFPPPWSQRCSITVSATSIIFYCSRAEIERECIRLSIIYQAASLHKVLLFFSAVLEAQQNIVYCNEKPQLLRYKSNYSKIRIGYL